MNFTMRVISTMKKPSFIFMVVYLVLLILLFHPRIAGNDEVGYYVYLRSAIIDRDFDFTNEFKYFKDSYLIVGYSPATVKPVNGLPIGSAILWLPFFLIAHFGIWISNYILGSVIPFDGYSAPYIYAICFGSSLYAFIGLRIIYEIGRQFFSTKAITTSIILFWLASPLVFYMYLQPAMSHANSVFTVSLFIYLWFKTRARNDWRKWILLGVSGSLMTLVRFQDAIFLLIPFLDWLVTVWNNKTAQPQIQPVSLFYNLIIFISAFVIMFIPQLVAWHSIFGSYFSGPTSHHVIQGTNFLAPHLIAVLFSGRHGLITWNPIVLCSLIGTFWLWQKDKRLAGLLGLSFIIQLYVISCWHEWWGAHSFGHRMFLSSTPFFVLGLVAFVDHITKRISYTWVYLIGVLLIMWNILLIAQYALGLIDRDGTTPFLTVIYNQLFVIPTHLHQILVQFWQVRLLQ